MQIIWYAKNIFLDEEERYEMMMNTLEYHASFINAEGVKKAREARNSDVIESDIDLEDRIKRGESIFENLEDLKEITRSLKKDTNKKKKSSDMLDIQSPIQKLIRE